MDAACCTGYGSHILSYAAKKVIGLEVDEGCIADAKSDWQRDNIDFRVFDIDKGELPNADVLVTIETAEHVQDFEHFLDQITKHIKRLVIFCVPLGGTSHAYTEAEKLLPGGECNDFNNEAYVEKIFTDKGWKLQTNFRFGYSGFFVFFKKEPRRLK